jgi:hypothetical protein
LQFAFNIRLAAVQTVPQSGNEGFSANEQIWQRQLMRLAETQLKQGLR